MESTFRLLTRAVGQRAAFLCHLPDITKIFQFGGGIGLAYNLMRLFVFDIHKSYLINSH